MKTIPMFLALAAVLWAATLAAQENTRPSRGAVIPARERGRNVIPAPRSVADTATDLGVVRDSQKEALEQLRALKENVDDPRGKALIEAVEVEMEKAIARLGEATEKNSTTTLPPALEAEQAAYQALLKMAAREYRVSRGRNQGGGGGGDRAQRQLDQLDLKQAENRYETQRQATPQQNSEQREQLQILSRLKELAQRQQDLNEKIQELQTALQEAKTEEEREDIRRRLKRLREQEQEMLADLDELRQRMDRSENQSRMTDARQRLDQTRSEIQRATEALDGQSVPQALASGTRAQRDLQKLSDEFRKKSSSQFSEEMRRMRNDARQLAQKQEELAQQLDQLADAKHKTLSDSDERRDLGAQWTQQKSGVTNLLNEMRAVSEQAETAEPLLSKQLYDTLRQSNQEELNKSLDYSSELVQRGFLSQAGQFEQRARQGIDQLKQGVEKAAESVIGDDVEALRLAKRELDDLSERLEKEIAAAGTNALSTNAIAARRPDRISGTDTNSSNAGQASGPPREGANPGESNPEGQPRPGENADARQASRAAGDGQSQQDPQANVGARQPGDAQQQAQNGSQDGSRQGSQQGSQNGSQGGSPNSPGQTGNAGAQQAQGGQGRAGRAPSTDQASNDGADSPGAVNRAGRAGRRNFFDGGGGGGGGEGGGYYGGPLTGDDFVGWSDRLRDVEEMLDDSELRSEVARIRDRARAVRWDYRQKGQKPDWAVVRLQISGPLVEVRSRVGEELARRESSEAMVPIDRDPVPRKFSELVRRYYEELGKSD